jgi:hypothetical protein
MNKKKQESASPTERELLGHFIDMGLLSMSIQELRVDWMRLHLENFKLNQLVTQYKIDRQAGPAAKKSEGDKIMFYLVSLAIVKDAEGQKITKKSLDRFWDELILEIRGSKFFEDDLVKPVASQNRLAVALKAFNKIKKNWETASKTEFPEKD